MWAQIKERLSVTPRTLGIYVVVYLSAGLIMNSFGKLAGIAEFRHWWQVGTCYGLYLIPTSLWVREKTFFDQYLFGLLVMALLELMGYALGTSVAFEGNILDRVLGERNFTLAMTVFFAVYLPLGNMGVAILTRLLPGAAASVAPLELEVASDGYRRAE